MMSSRHTGKVVLIVARSDGFLGPQAFFEGERMLCRQMPVAATTMIGCKVVKG